MTAETPKIFVIHENDAWVVPLRERFIERGVPYEEWHLDQGSFNLSEPPPEGVFYNRMSASSHTRGHRYAPELTATVVSWLEGYGRRLFNGGRAIDLEVSKTRQYAALARHGIRVPRTLAAVGRERVLEAITAFGDGPLLLKPNRGGKGLGIQYFETADAARDHVQSDAFESGLDGHVLVQQYVEAAEPVITRAEFIGGRFFYAVRVETGGTFELCPADVCQVDEGPGTPPSGPRFDVLPDGIPDFLERKFTNFLAEVDIDMAGIEFVTDRDGVAWTYDVNTNTNYNAEAEARDGRSGMDRIAEVLGDALYRAYPKLKKVA